MDTTKMQFIALVVVLLVGGIFICKAFEKMRYGYGRYNIKVLCILIVAPMATIIALVEPKAVTAAMSILGAIAGYAFGVHDESQKPGENS